MASSPSTKRTRISEDLELSQRMPEDHNTDVHIDSPWTYLIAMRTVLCTMALAGCYQTVAGGAGPEEEKVLFAPLDPLLQHLARAESYVLKHAQGPQRFAEAQVMAKLRIIDEHQVRVGAPHSLHGRDPWSGLRINAHLRGEPLDD
jgi:hypothetical protein